MALRAFALSAGIGMASLTILSTLWYIQYLIFSMTKLAPSKYFALLRTSSVWHKVALAWLPLFFLLAGLYIGLVGGYGLCRHILTFYTTHGKERRSMLWWFAVFVWLTTASGWTWATLWVLKNVLQTSPAEYLRLVSSNPGSWGVFDAIFFPSLVGATGIFIGMASGYLLFNYITDSNWRYDMLELDPDGWYELRS